MYDLGEQDSWMTKIVPRTAGLGADHSDGPIFRHHSFCGKRKAQRAAVQTKSVDGSKVRTAAGRPILAIAASTASGKSTAARAALADFELSRFGGDGVFYLPTLKLAEEEAAAESGGHVTRGRTATDPSTQRPMCDRFELAEAVGKAGLNVHSTLQAALPRTRRLVRSRLGRDHGSPRTFLKPFPK
jgi:hypothetical protein